MKKYYAVAAGHETGIYEDWETCQRMISGYPKAKFKAFTKIEDAEKFIDENSFLIDEVEIDYDALVKEALGKGRVIAFTDGSYSSNSPKSGYGCYIKSPKGDVIEISNVVHTKRFKESNNITPEVMAVLESINWAISNEFETITIFYDLELIGKWATDEFKANADIGKFFLKELKKFEDIISIDYVWVKGHSGVEYNEIADRLARQALSSAKPVGKYGANSFSGSGVPFNKVQDIITEFKNINGVEVELKNDDDTVLRYKISNKNESLTVSYFKRNGKTWLQGKVKSLFSYFLSMYTINIPQFDMVRAYSNSYKQTLDIKDIKEEIKKFNFPHDYPESAIKLVSQSLLMLKLEREEIDYSHYTQPAYRALEGHLKYLCKVSGHQVTRKTLGSIFKRSSDGSWVLEVSVLKNHPNKTKIEEVYNLVYNKRHPISHFGEVLVNGFDDTLLIPHAQEAKDRIKEVHDLLIFV